MLIIRIHISPFSVRDYPVLETGCLLFSGRLGDMENEKEERVVA